MEVTGAAVYFPISGTDKLAVQIQKHMVITNFFEMQCCRAAKVASQDVLIIYCC